MNTKTKIKINRIIILPIILHGCETWLLTLREGRRLRVFENEVLRKIFGPKRDEVTGKWRKLHNEELNDLHSSPKIIRVIIKEMGKAWRTHGRQKMCIWGFGGGNLTEGVHLKTPGVDGSTTLKCIPRTWGSGHGLN